MTEAFEFGPGRKAQMTGMLLIDLCLIDDDPLNPRGPVGDITDLAADIAYRGQEDAIHVVKKNDGRYLLHEGHRRVAALQHLGRQQAKAIERHFATDLDRLLSQGAIHVHRKDFSPMAWGRYCHRLFWEHNLTRDQIAGVLHVSPLWVKNHIALVALEPAEQDAVEAGELTQGEALYRVACRRAAREGRPAPALPAEKKTKAIKAAPVDPYLNHDHRLARQVAVRCASNGAGHAARPKIGLVGCGECWEDEIRADALHIAARPALAAA